MHAKVDGKNGKDIRRESRETIDFIEFLLVSFLSEFFFHRLLRLLPHFGHEAGKKTVKLKKISNDEMEEGKM